MMNKLQVALVAILAVILLSAGAYGYIYKTILNPFTGKMDYYAEYTSSDPVNASNGTFAGGIIIGSSVTATGGAIKYDSNSLYFYNGTAWVVAGTGGSADTNCDANGECTLIVYFANITSWDVNEADDLYLNGSRPLTSGWYAGKSINATTLNATADKFCNLTQCFSLAQLTSDRTNTTLEVFTAVDNGTFMKPNTTIYLSATTFSGFIGIGNLTPCAEGQIAKVASGVWACGTDVSGSGGGVGLIMATGEWMTPNETAGGKQNFNVTGYINSSYLTASSDKFCNTTACYSLAQLLAYTDTTCAAAGACANVVYSANVTNYDMNNADDYQLNGSRMLTGNLTTATNATYAVGNTSNWWRSIYVQRVYTNFVNSSYLTTTSDKLCNTTNCYTLGNLLADVDTNCDAAGECTNVVYGSNTTSWDKNEADDVYLNGTRAFTGNVTTTDSVVIDADNKAMWYGADQDAGTYFNGTCLIFLVKGGDQIHLC